MVVELMPAIAILGATGSIGQSTLAVLAQHPDQYQVIAMTAQRNVAAMLPLIQRFRPRYVAMADVDAAQQLQQQLPGDLHCEVWAGVEGLVAVAQLTEVDLVMAAIVGAAGLAPTLAAVQSGKTVLLANKEALVMSGQLFIDAVQQSGSRLLPIDSEHNAIFQCLPAALQQPLGQGKLAEHGIDKIILTGSGGPFRDLPLAALAEQTAAAACQHPNWSMGPKISVDSATMVNKGLEYIEARWLFGAEAHQLQVLLHPQSVIHSMVQYVDGSVLAQLGQPDMCTPIAYALGYPQRIASGVAALDFTQLGTLTFAAVEAARYPCLQLAIDACWQGQWATTTLNAANEVAVAGFLAGRLKFTDIYAICAAVLEQMPSQTLNSLAQILSVDEQARALAQQQLERRSSC